MKQKLFILTCVLALVPICVMAQQAVTIRGAVYDDVGSPLPGANVFIKDTAFGSATDTDGMYDIIVPAVSVVGQEVELIAQFIGFTSKTFKVSLASGQNVTQDFALKPDVLELESIVVTGIGIALQKEKLGVSVAQVKAETITGSDEANLVQSLAGKAPGVVVRETSGDPGTSSFIRIRGAASIDRSTQPLFVIDGVPINNRTDFINELGFNGGTETSNRAADINNEDIQSVEILKGPAAAAIYGSRASNGVVIINTKSGKPGKTKVSYKFSVSATRLSSDYPIQRWYGQGLNGRASSSNPRSWGVPLNVPDSPHFDPSQPVTEVFDQIDLISGTGWGNENNITVSGGREYTTFFLSFGRTYDGGHWKADESLPGRDALVGGKPNPTSYERYSVRLKASQVITSKLKLTGNVAYANSEGHYVQRGDNAVGLMLGALRTPAEFNNWPYIDPETGFHRSYRYQSAATLRRTRGFDNPFFVMYEHDNPRDVGRLYGYLKGEYDLLDWVKLDYTIGSDYSSDEAIYLNPQSGSREGGVGELNKTNFTNHEIDGNFLATFKADRFLKKISPSLAGTFVLGHNINRREYHRLETNGIDMGVPGFNQLDNTVSTNLSTNEFEFLIHTESYFVQTTIDLFDQLYLTGALRNDGSSTFGAAKRRHWYPKMSAAWDFTKSRNIRGLSFGKLRFAYGESGVQPGVYDTISGFSTGGKGFGLFTSTALNTTYRGKSGYFSSSNKGNDIIKPERTKEVEVGTNLAFLDSRFGVDLTYYKQTSTDVIFDLNLVPSTGFFSQTDNGATIENKGWELALNAAPVRKRNFTWNVGVNYARNKNEVTKMRDRNGVEVIEAVGRWAYAGEGHELGELRLLTFVRFGRDDLNDGRGEFRDGVYIDEEYAGQWQKGDVYIAADGYPVMSSAPMWSGLSANPDWTGSIRNEFTLFKNFTVGAFIDMAQGHHIMNHGAGALFSYGTHLGTRDRGTMGVFGETISLNGKHGTGPFERTDVKAIGPGAGLEVERSESFYRSAGAGFSGDGFQFTEDASYVKLREISFSYTFRNQFIRRMGLSDVNLRLSGRNLKTWTDYSGFDPETNRRQASNARDSDYFNQPQSKSYVLTVRVNY